MQQSLNVGGRSHPSNSNNPPQDPPPPNEPIFIPELKPGEVFIPIDATQPPVPEIEPEVIEVPIVEPIVEKVSLIRRIARKILKIFRRK